MAFDWNEFSDPESSLAEQETASEILEDLAEVSSEEEAIDTEYMTQVDFRLEVASCYRALLCQELFDNPNQATRIVQREMRSFITERLEVLLNIKNPVEKTVAKLPPVLEALAELTEEQVKALVVVANMALKKTAPVAQPAKPSVRKQEAAAPAKPAQPTVRKQKTTTAPVVKPAAAPAPAQVKPAPAPPSTAPAPLKKKPGPKPKAQAPAPPAPTNGQIVKVVDPETKEEKMMKMVEDPRTGEERFLEVKAGQVRPANAVPMPANLDLAMQSSALASVQAAGASGGLATIANILAQAK